MRRATASCGGRLHEFDEPDPAVKNEGDASAVERGGRNRSADADRAVGDGVVDLCFDVGDLEAEVIESVPFFEGAPNRGFAGKWLDQLQARLTRARREELHVDTLSLVGHYFGHRLQAKEAAVAGAVAVDVVDDNADVMKFHSPVKSTPMAIVIQPYTGEHVTHVRDFNRRLRAGGETEFEFPEDAVPVWLPKKDDRRIFQEIFVAVSEAGIHGGYIIKTQDFAFAGEPRPIGYYHLPLSEGIVDKTYGLVGSQLLIDALRRQPVMYALGMGGFDRPLPRMLQGIGWKLQAVPFFFRVVRAGRFLRNIQPLRRSAGRRLVADAAAFSGMGAVGLRFLQRRAPVPQVDHEIVSEFNSWTDQLWVRAKAEYAMVGSRDAATLNVLYPASSTRFIKVRVADIGWAVLLDTQMRGHKYFGDMRVGTIADCFASPADAAAVLRAATRVLESRGVDLIVSNQSHTAWGNALRANGYRSGPTNFIFAASKKLAALLEPWNVNVERVHLTRGDGDGPIHL